MAIILPGGFNITNNEPVDARFSVADASARLGLSAANVYEGLLVYQQDTNEIYGLIDASDPSVSGNWALVSSLASGSAITGITAGLGLSGGGNSGTVTVTLDTGSAHFTNALAAINYAGIFKQTGSYWSTTKNLQITGSLTVGDGLLRLKEFTSTPTPEAGAIFYSGSNFFFGLG